MTLSKLAQLANVSVSAVSKAFSGRSDISDAMREHVFQVARENGCFQQFYHVPYDKPVIAVIIPEIISDYFVQYVHVLKRHMDERGYTMLLSISNFDPALTSELVHYYTVHNKTQGILLMSPTDKPIPDGLSTAIVSLGLGEGTKNGAHVMQNPRIGIAQAIRYLIEQGHRHIGYIGEPLTQAMKPIFCDELTNAGLEVRPEWIIFARTRFEEAGKEGVRRILSCSERPTVIFSAYGYITRGIIEELNAQGLQFPRDMSVVSMDNDPPPVDPHIDISCIPSEIERSCAIAMQLLEERMFTTQPNALCNIVIPTSFHVGRSIAPLLQ